MSKIIYQLELLSNLQENSEEPDFLTIAKYDTNPQFNIDDELLFKGFTVGSYDGLIYDEKKYDLKLKITKCIKEVHLGQGKEVYENGILLIRYLAEAEDRSLMLEIRETLRNNNLEKIPI